MERMFYMDFEASMAEPRVQQALLHLQVSSYVMTHDMLFPCIKSLFTLPLYKIMVKTMKQVIKRIE